MTWRLCRSRVAERRGIEKVVAGVVHVGLTHSTGAFSRAVACQSPMPAPGPTRVRGVAGRLRGLADARRDEWLHRTGLGWSAASLRVACPPRESLASLGPPRHFERNPGAWAAQSFDQLREFESRGSEIDGAPGKRLTELV